MVIIASKKILEGHEINLLHKLKDCWVVISKNETIEDIKNLEDNFFAIDKAFLCERVPMLKDKLDQPVNTTINIDYSTGEININRKHFHLGIPTHSAKSTRQVNTDFSFAKWVYNHRKSYKKTVINLFILFISAYFFGWFFYIPMTAYLAIKILGLLKERDMFKSGDLCPAIVIDEANSTIAVLTDLTLGMGKYPLIRVKKVALPVKYRKLGTKIPVAGAYYRTKKIYSHWNYYEPLPLPSGVKNEKVIEEKIAAIPSIEWIKLKTEATKLNCKTPEGYYPLEIEKSSWKEIDLNTVKWM